MFIKAASLTRKRLRRRVNEPLQELKFGRLGKIANFGKKIPKWPNFAKSVKTGFKSAFTLVYFTQ